MSGCYPPESGICEHGFITKFGCVLCDRVDDVSPIIQQIQLLTEMLYKIEQRVEILELSPGIK